LSKNKVNIAILEPSQIVYEGLSNLLLKSGKFFHLFRIDSFSELEKNIREEELDILIINPAQVQNKEKEFASLRKLRPEACWVALIYSFYDQHFISLFDKSIHITDSVEKIIESIDRLNDPAAPSQYLDQDDLSEREIEVLKLVIGGMSNKEIADKLFISIHTVISHRKNISQKTGIKSQSGLTIYAISNKIIQIEDYKN